MQINDLQQSSLGHPSLAVTADEKQETNKQKKTKKSEITWVKILPQILYSNAFFTVID